MTERARGLTTRPGGRGTYLVPPNAPRRGRTRHLRAGTWILSRSSRLQRVNLFLDSSLSPTGRRSVYIKRRHSPFRRRAPTVVIPMSATEANAQERTGVFGGSRKRESRVDGKNVSRDKPTRSYLCTRDDGMRANTRVHNNNIPPLAARTTANCIPTRNSELLVNRGPAAI